MFETWTLAVFVLMNSSPQTVAGLLAILPVFECPRTALSSRFNDYDVA